MIYNDFHLEYFGIIVIEQAAHPKFRATIHTLKPKPPLANHFDPSPFFGFIVFCSNNSMPSPEKMNAKQLVCNKHFLLFAMVILEGPAVAVEERGSV